VSVSSKNTRKHAIAMAIVCNFLLVLPACIPNLRKPLPAPPLPQDFNGMITPDNSALVSVEEFYNDPTLLCLINQALFGNQELRIRNEDIQIANNEVLARRGAYLPFVTFGGTDIGGRASYTKYSTFTLPGAGIKDDPYRPGQFFPNPLPDYILGPNLF